jgi:hypothetical protein
MSAIQASQPMWEFKGKHTKMLARAPVERARRRTREGNMASMWKVEERMCGKGLCRGYSPGMKGISYLLGCSELKKLQILHCKYTWRRFATELILASVVKFAVC